VFHWLHSSTIPTAERGDMKSLRKKCRNGGCGLERHARAVGEWAPRLVGTRARGGDPAPAYRIADGIAVAPVPVGDGLRVTVHRSSLSVAVSLGGRSESEIEILTPWGLQAPRLLVEPGSSPGVQWSGIRCPCVAYTCRLQPATGGSGGLLASGSGFRGRSPVGQSGHCPCGRPGADRGDAGRRVSA
jgi:hypothetical protein